jgi:hypothetical protein
MMSLRWSFYSEGTEILQRCQPYGLGFSFGMLIYNNAGRVFCALGG